MQFLCYVKTGEKTVAKMLKICVIFIGVFVLCSCQTSNGPNNYGNFHVHKKPHHSYYYHHLLFGGALYYLAFILIKIKVAFVLGVLLTIFLVAGKLFAVIKYAEYMKKPYDSHHHEKIFIDSPIMKAPSFDHIPHHGPSYDASSFSSFPPGEISAASSNVQYYNSPPPSAGGFGGSASSYGQYYDSPPPSASGGFGGQAYSSAPPSGNNFGQYYDSPPPNYRGRNFKSSYFSNLSDYYAVFLDFVKKTNVTDMAFRKLKIISEDCKKKFVCKMEHKLKNNAILSGMLFFLRDDELQKYEANATITCLNDCDKMYSTCTDTY